MALKAGRVGVNPASVDALGNVKPTEPTDCYTKSQADNKFAKKSNTYSKEDCEDLFALKANTYSKEDCEDLFAFKGQVPIYQDFSGTATNGLFRTSLRSDFKVLSIVPLTNGYTAIPFIDGYGKWGVGCYSLESQGLAPYSGSVLVRVFYLYIN